MNRPGKTFIEWWCPVALLLASLLVVNAQPMPSKETQIKAVFLYNFAQFAQWPAEAFTNPSAPVVIGILGVDPFGPFLDEIVKGEAIGGHPVEVRRFNNVSEAKSSHILFISKDLSDPLSTVIESLEDENIITVSDVNDFTRKGGMIRFFLESKKIRFEVNMTTYKRNGVVLSSRLLRLAEICCE